MAAKWIILIYIHSILKPVRVQVPMPMFGGPLFSGPMPPPMPAPVFPPPMFAAPAMPIPAISFPCPDFLKQKRSRRTTEKSTTKSELNSSELNNNGNMPFPIPVPVPFPMPMPMPLLQPPPQPPPVLCRQPIQTTIAPTKNCPPCPSSCTPQCCFPCEKCGCKTKERSPKQKQPYPAFIPIQIPLPPPPPPIFMVPVSRPDYKSQELCVNDNWNSCNSRRSKKKNRYKSPILRNLESDDDLSDSLSSNESTDIFYNIANNNIHKAIDNKETVQHHKKKHKHK